MKKKFLSIILSAMIIGSCAISFAGCGENQDKIATPDTAVATSDTATSDEVAATVTDETVPALSDTDQAIIDKGLKVDDKGNITDSKGNKVDIKEDGTVEVKTQSGETVRVKADDVKSANVSNQKVQEAAHKSNNSSSSVGNSDSNSKAGISKSNNNSASSNIQSSKQESSKAEETKVEETKHTHLWVDITKQLKVVDKKEYTYEEPVYEYKVRTICNDCGADITGNVEHIFEHIENDPNSKGSYHAEKKKVQTGTTTVTVPEEYHYETQIIGCKCSSCGKTEYY